MGGGGGEGRSLLCFSSIKNATLQNLRGRYEGVTTQVLQQIPSTGLRHPSFNHCRI